MDHKISSMLIACKFIMFFTVLLQLFMFLTAANSDEYQPFFQNYYVSWGYDHFSSIDNGKEIQFYLDQSHGAGIQSNLKYGSGFFGMMIKLHKGDSAGVVTSFYLHSHRMDSNYKDIHDEIDLEFLGNKEGRPYSIQTNIYVNGRGDREQRFNLWFDPTTDFHHYRILWNEHQIVFFVDEIPIRVLKNNTKVPYPSQPMKIEGSIYCGDSWVTDGGLTKTNWSHAPFYAHYKGFNAVGCPQAQTQSSDCSSDRYWWNRKNYWQLNSKEQQKLYENAKDKYLTYDYCKDSHRYPTPPPECLE